LGVDSEIQELKNYLDDLNFPAALLVMDQLIQKVAVRDGSVD
jgi:hypothetical protein